MLPKSLRPEDYLDRFFVFDKADLGRCIAQRGGSITLTTANFIKVIESFQEEVRKKYFVMDCNDPLVATVMMTYIKLLNAEQRLKKQVGKDVGPIRRGNDA